MDSLWAQLILQLGISGLIVFTGFKIAMKLIEQWTKNEAVRTAAWTAAEESRTKVIQDGFRSDIEAHGEITKYIHTHTTVLSRIEGKIDAAFDLTPVKGVRDYETKPSQLSEESAVPRPTPPSLTYSVKRPKTSG